MAKADEEAIYGPRFLRVRAARRHAGLLAGYEPGSAVGPAQGRKRTVETNIRALGQFLPIRDLAAWLQVLADEARCVADVLEAEDAVRAAGPAASPGLLAAQDRARSALRALPSPSES